EEAAPDDAVAVAAEPEPEPEPEPELELELELEPEAQEQEPAGEGEGAPAPRIHVPDESLGREDADEAAPAKKRTRRGSRGGRRTRGAFGCGRAPALADRATERARSWYPPSRPRPLHCLVFRGPVGSPFHAMSYAIINVGGKQYVVHEGEKLLVDRLATEPGE